MSHRKSPLAIGLLAAACAHETPGAANGAPPRSTSSQMPPGYSGPLPRPADPEAVIRAEFEVAEQRGSAAAYILFAQRHPGHPLAKESRRRAQAMSQQTPD